MKSFEYIDHPDSLTQAVKEINSAQWVALDTEADSLHHYVEKLCLLQMSIEGRNFVIDPLANLDLEELAKALNHKALILHGADFDIRILRRTCSHFNPTKIFDTMIAAQILGYEKQGLADLAKRHCEVSLSKSSQKADWSQRPLTPELLTYAASDTHYLKVIHDAMENELKSLGRLEWHRQNCQKLLEALSVVKDESAPTQPRWQIKGSKLLGPKALTLLKHLWSWREEEAKREDRPSFKILTSDILLNLAEWAAVNPGKDVEELPQAPRNVRGRLRDPLNRVLKEAQALPPAEYIGKTPLFPRKRWGPKENQRLLDLKLERDRIASELKINASVLITNSVLELLASEPPKDSETFQKLTVLLPWQKDVMERDFLKVTAR